MAVATILTLPLELRLNIIEQTFGHPIADNTKYDLGTLHDDCEYCDDNRIFKQQCYMAAKLLQVNHQLNAETRTILYDRVRYWFSTDLDRLSGSEQGPQIYGMDLRVIINCDWDSASPHDQRFFHWVQNMSKVGIYITLPKFTEIDGERYDFSADQIKACMQYWKAKLNLARMVQILNQSRSLKSLNVRCLVHEHDDPGGSDALRDHLGSFKWLRDTIDLKVITEVRSMEFDMFGFVWEGTGLECCEADQAYLSKLHSTSRSVFWPRAAGKPLTDTFQKLMSWVCKSFNFMLQGENWMPYEVSGEWDPMESIDLETGRKIIEAMKQAWAAHETNDGAAFASAFKHMRKVAREHQEAYSAVLERNLEGAADGTDGP